MLQLPPTTKLFPYTTLFRSRQCDVAESNTLKNKNRPPGTEQSPITSSPGCRSPPDRMQPCSPCRAIRQSAGQNNGSPLRSEEHTSELQSLRHLVCRLLLEKK